MATNALAKYLSRNASGRVPYGEASRKAGCGPHVRFDGRGWETESWQVGLRRRIQRAVNSHRNPKTTAPIFDSTCLAKFRVGGGYMPVNE